MLNADAESVPALIRGVIEDARALIRAEIALARGELREEMSAMRSVGAAFTAGAFLALIAVVLLSIALGGAIAYLLDLPGWVGYGVVALLLGVAAYLLVNRGRTGLAKIQTLPQTTESARENLAWLRSRSLDN